MDSGNYSSRSSQTGTVKRVIISERISPSPLPPKYPSSSSTSPGPTLKLEPTIERKRLSWNLSGQFKVKKKACENTYHQWNNLMASEESSDSQTVESNDLLDLSEDDIDFLLANTGFSVDQIHNWHQEFIDKCSNGLIGFEQFKSYYKLLLPGYLDKRQKEELIMKLFRLFDIDNDGYLNYSEFLVSFWIRCKAPIKEKFTWIFNMLDADRNGYLNYYELKQALTLCLNVNYVDQLIEQLNRELTAASKKFNKQSFIKQFLYDSSTSDTSSSNVDTSESDSSDCDLDYYECYSHVREQQSLDEKLNQIVLMLNILAKREDLATAAAVPTSNYYNRASVLLFNTPNINDLRRVNIDREQFIYLCERYELLRKLIVPIRHFYDEIQLNMF